MPSFKCKDIGMKDDFEVNDPDREELMKIIELHARESHSMQELTPDMREKIEKAVKH